MKSKNCFFSLLRTAVIATPLYLHAMEVGKDKAENDYNRDIVKQNSQVAIGQAEKDIDSRAAAGAGSSFIDDDSSNQGVKGASIANNNNFFNASASQEKSAFGARGDIHDEIDLDQISLSQKIETARQAAASFKREYLQLQNRSVSDAARSDIKSSAERGLATWQKTSHHYGYFIQEAVEEKISDSIRDQILNLITASNEASKEAQELLEFLSPGETLRVLNLAGSEVFSSVSNAHTRALAHDDAVIPHASTQTKKDPKEFLFPLPQLHKKSISNETFDLTQDRNEEESAIGKLFARLVERKSNDHETANHEVLWDKWASAAEEHRATYENLQRVSKKLDCEKQKLENLDIDQTILEQIAKHADFVSNVTAWMNSWISISGAAQATSTLARAINYFLAHAHLNLAQRDYDFAKAAYDKAAKKSQQALREANQADVEAEKQRRAAIAYEQQQTKTLAQSLKPPAHNARKDQWHLWEKNLTALFHPPLDATEIETLQAAKENPLTAYEAAYAWQARTRETESKQKGLHKENNSVGMQLAESSYQRAQEQATTARASANEAQMKFNQLEEKANDAFQKREALEKIIEQLQLREQSVETLTAIEEIKKQLRDASIEECLANKAKDEAVEKLREDAIQKKTSAMEAEREAVRAFKEQQKAKKIRARSDLNIERTLADQAAWRAVWPEEVLYEKLSEQKGEYAFDEAWDLKNEAAWLTAQNEAKELAELWQALSENNHKAVTSTSEADKKSVENYAKQSLNQKKFWEKQDGIAKGKIFLIRMKELWSPFDKAVETFVQAPLRGDDSKNANAICSTATRLKDATSEAKRLFSVLSPLLEEKLTNLIKALHIITEEAAEIASPKSINRHPWLNMDQSISLVLENATSIWAEEDLWLREALLKSVTFVQQIDSKEYSRRAQEEKLALQAKETAASTQRIEGQLAQVQATLISSNQRIEEQLALVQTRLATREANTLEMESLKKQFIILDAENGKLLEKLELLEWQKIQITELAKCEESLAKEPANNNSALPSLTQRRVKAEVAFKAAEQAKAVTDQRRIIPLSLWIGPWLETEAQSRENLAHLASNWLDALRSTEAEMAEVEEAEQYFQKWTRLAAEIRERIRDRNARSAREDSDRSSDRNSDQLVAPDVVHAWEQSTHEQANEAEGRDVDDAWTNFASEK